MLRFCWIGFSSKFTLCSWSLGLTLSRCLCLHAPWQPNSALYLLAWSWARISSLSHSIRSLVCIDARAYTRVAFLPFLQKQMAFAPIFHLETVDIFLGCAAGSFPIPSPEADTSTLTTEAVHHFLGSKGREPSYLIQLTLRLASDERRKWAWFLIFLLMAACALVHLCYQWGLPLLPAPNLFHEYVIEACGKEVANEIGFLLSPIPSYFKLSCYLPLTFKFGNMLCYYCCCYGGHFFPAPWQKWNSLGTYLFTKKPLTLEHSVSWMACYLSSLMGSWKIIFFRSFCFFLMLGTNVPCGFLNPK